MELSIILLIIAGIAALIVSGICIVNLNDKIASILKFFITSIISVVLFIIAFVLSATTELPLAAICVSGLGVILSIICFFSAASHLNEYNETQRDKKLFYKKKQLKDMKENVLLLKKKQQNILDSYDEQTRVVTGDETINNFILSQSDDRFSENKTFINNIN